MRTALFSVFLAFFLLLFRPTSAQRSRYWAEQPGTWLLNAGLGTTRYTGDLNEFGNLAHLQLGTSLSLAASYRLSNYLSLRAEGQLYYLHADQRYTRNSYNNLSFHSLNPDVWVGVQVDFWPINHQTRNLIPYALAGVGLTYLRPQAAYKGRSYGLSALKTEGVDYNLFPFIIRYGAGVPVWKNKRVRLHLEGTYTHVFSDYLDDVSTVYAAPASFVNPLTVVLADRRSEIGLPIWQGGEQRGNSGKNDGYFIVSARLVYVLSTSNLRQYRQMLSR